MALGRKVLQRVDPNAAEITDPTAMRRRLLSFLEAQRQ
jgi:hypothetical protein